MMSTVDFTYLKQTLLLIASYVCLDIPVMESSSSTCRQTSKAAALQAAQQQQAAAAAAAAAQAQPAAAQVASSELEDVSGDIQVDEWNADPNEPRYCLCNQVSYGEMVGCDNNDVSEGSVFSVRAFMVFVFVPPPISIPSPSFLTVS